VDDDERDRRKLAEIIKKMDERKLVKESDARRNAATVPVKTGNAPSVKVPSDRDDSVEMSKKGAKRSTESQDALKKSVPIKQDTTFVPVKIAGAVQRDEARRWAASETSDSEVVTQSSVSKSSSRQKGAKKASERVSETVVETAQSLEIQNFIASQYPPIDEGLSSTVRLGRGLVSGALGKRNEDPKLFGAAVNLVECSVRIQTTKKRPRYQYRRRHLIPSILRSIAVIFVMPICPNLRQIWGHNRITGRWNRISGAARNECTGNRESIEDRWPDRG